MSGNLASNIGADETLVYSGPNSTAKGTTGNIEFDFSLFTPFVYDPSEGNLLLTVFPTAGSDASTALDAATVSTVMPGIR